MQLRIEVSAPASNLVDGKNLSARPKGNVEHLTKYFVAKKALIMGVTGQDGSFLTELLRANAYEVHGLVRHPQPGMKSQGPPQQTALL